MFCLQSLSLVISAKKPYNTHTLYSHPPGGTPMKIALISARPHIADKKTNLNTIEQYITKNPADIYVFGELFLTGYNCKDELRSLAEPLTGPSIQHLKKLAKKHNAYLVCGLPLRDSNIKGVIYNSVVLVHPTGTVNHYNKWFLPTFGPFEETLYFNQGEDLPVFKTKLGTIGLLICYDLYFPEISKALTLQGADILICVSASPSTTRQFFETLCPTRAIENTVFLVYVNLVGAQENIVTWGGAQLYGPLGNLLVKAPYFKESIITYEIDLKELDLARSNRPVIRDIRPEIYHDLYYISRQHIKPQPPQKKSTTST